MINKIIQKLINLENLIQIKQQNLSFNVGDFSSEEEIQLDILNYFKHQSYEELYKIKKYEEKAVKDQIKIDTEIEQMNEKIKDFEDIELDKEKINLVDWSIPNIDLNFNKESLGIYLCNNKEEFINKVSDFKGETEISDEFINKRFLVGEFPHDYNFLGVLKSSEFKEKVSDFKGATGKIVNISITTPDANTLKASSEILKDFNERMKLHKRNL